MLAFSHPAKAKMYLFVTVKLAVFRGDFSLIEGRKKILLFGFVPLTDLSNVNERHFVYNFKRELEKKI